MSTVDEIEAAISNLPPQDFARVRDWLLEQDSMVATAHRPAISMEEIERRGEEIASGKVKPVSGAEFLGRIDQIRKEIS
jgi:hypothetical protein